MNGGTRLMNTEPENSPIHDLETQKPLSDDFKIHDPETQKPPLLASGKRENIYDLETQGNKQTIYDLETQQCSPPSLRGQNIYDLETQKSSPLISKKKNIYDLQTQGPRPFRSRKNKDVYKLDTQISPPQRSKNIYEHETQVPSKNIYDLETQHPGNVHNSSDDSETDLEDSDDVAEESNEKSKRCGRNLRNKKIEDENENLKKKTKKKTKAKSRVDTSDEEAKDSRLKPKRKKKIEKSKGTKKIETSPENSDDHSHEKELLNNEEKPGRADKKNNVLLSDNDSPFSGEDPERHSVLTNGNISLANDSNSESFIGMTIGRKRLFVLNSSSESESDTQNKNEKPVKSDEQVCLKGDKPKANTLDSTYDVNIQSSIDELYVNEVNASATQPQEESQFINEVLSTEGRDSEEALNSPFIVDNEEALDSPFIVENEEALDSTFNVSEDEEFEGSPHLLPPGKDG